MKRVMGKNKNYVVGIYDDTRMSHNLSQAQKNKEIAAKVAKETLDKLEKENFVKYIINEKGEKEYQRVE